jgi:hypothetical protein
MRKVDIYIETTDDNYSKIELFSDEQININSSIQNIQDLSKVYTDFTQSFTVPASTINNDIFTFFYQSDNDSLVNHNKRRNAFIEIGTIPFRSGKIQLEKANVSNNKVENYTITFYGNLMSLKDKFADDTLQDLNLTAYNHTYNGTEVKNRITDSTEYDVRYPLISQGRKWSYKDGSSTDISTNAGRINYRELFPALKVARIFDAIQAKYNITFNSVFLSTKLFTDLFLYLNNQEGDFNFTGLEKVNILSSTPTSSTTGSINAANDTFRITGQTKEVTITLKRLTGSVNVACIVYAFVAGKKVEGYSTTTNDAPRTLAGLPSDQDITLYIQTSIGTIIKPTIVLSNNDGNTSSKLFISCDDLTTTNKISLFNFVPEIKVSDFLSGVFKMFNLTCYATALDTFQIEPLDEWYSKGAVIKLNDVDVSSIDIERHKLYKSISFDYEKSESYYNKEFAKVNNRELGCVKESFPDYDGEEYKVNVPFENINFVRETAYPNCPTVAILFADENDDKPYKNKPIFLYKSDAKVTDFWIDATVTTPLSVQITSYIEMGNTKKYNNVVYSNHFSQETDPFTLNTVNNSLYATYYEGYLSNLFNIKNRLTTLKAYFPISLITSLKLNDRLIIRDKRYIINELKANLTTGEVTLVLINDFRKIVNTSVPTQTGTSTVLLPILVPNEVSSVAVATTSPGVTFSSASFTTSGLTTITIGASPTEYIAQTTEAGIEIITEDGFNVTYEGAAPRQIDINLTSTYINEATATVETIYITQL